VLFRSENISRNINLSANNNSSTKTLLRDTNLIELDVEYKSFYETAQFITGLILYPIICTVGISGNILTLIVLQHPKLLTSTNVFLSALAVADLFKLFNDILYLIFNILVRTKPSAGNEMWGYMYPFSHYVLNQSVCVASWLTVCIGVERYLYVCHASRARVWCTVARARFTSALVFIVMSIAAIPTALRYTRIMVFLDSAWYSSEFNFSVTHLLVVLVLTILMFINCDYYNKIKQLPTSPLD
jgi:nociceptin receptor